MHAPKFQSLLFSKVWSFLCKRKKESKQTQSTNLSVKSSRGSKPPEPEATTSFANTAAMEPLVEEEENSDDKADLLDSNSDTLSEKEDTKHESREKYADDTGLLDLNWDMFSDTESIELERREKDHPAFYYTTTFNWKGDQ